VSVDATLAKGVDHAPGAEFVHAASLVGVPEESLSGGAKHTEFDLRKCLAW
jgi:hypothetical protein